MTARPPDNNVVELRPGLRPAILGAEALLMEPHTKHTRLSDSAIINLDRLKAECHDLSLAMQGHAPAEVARMMAGLEVFTQSFPDVVSKVEQANQTPASPAPSPDEER